VDEDVNPEFGTPLQARELEVTSSMNWFLASAESEAIFDIAFTYPIVTRHIYSFALLIRG
jgi:hypothetical protein